MATITHKLTVRKVDDLADWFERGRLNLQPGFQRDSVWSLGDRRKLIESVLRNHPIPAVFFYQREKAGVLSYDVIDGKQRIETLLLFMRRLRGGSFDLQTQLPGEGERQRLDWRVLCRQQRQHLVTSYELPVIEVNGDLADIIDLFVRINSTGKALTSAERRHARFYHSEFLREAARVAERYELYFRKEKILSAGQVSRMKHVELICELMVSLHRGGVINKKAALDSALEPNALTAAAVRRARAKTVAALNRTQRLFPELRDTRFAKLSDFYSLVLLVANFEEEKLVLTDRRANRLAREILAAFSTGVDKVRQRQKRAEGIGPGEELYRDYLLTVLEGTDEVSHRRKREEILRSLLQSLFARKADNRLFSEEQRRILWNSTDRRLCRECRRPVTWEDFSADHIQPFSKGGQTELRNAALVHRSCNSAKGNR